MVMVVVQWWKGGTRGRHREIPAAEKGGCEQERKSLSNGRGGGRGGSCGDPPSLAGLFRPTLLAPRASQSARQRGSHESGDVMLRRRVGIGPGEMGLGREPGKALTQEERHLLTRSGDGLQAWREADGWPVLEDTHTHN
uniref:Uncharacterized protein n=1 Tax=Physcomitrium patens TaxID=3218 RepID=A0A2K1IKC0_PHYPA|nr:hypothetical protein PHYPA_028420 [Physcomitrium patens]